MGVLGVKLEGITLRMKKWGASRLAPRLAMSRCEGVASGNGILKQ
jgi:hypothetical protein